MTAVLVALAVTLAAGPARILAWALVDRMAAGLVASAEELPADRDDSVLGRLVAEHRSPGWHASSRVLIALDQ